MKTRATPRQVSRLALFAIFAVAVVSGLVFLAVGSPLSERAPASNPIPWGNGTIVYVGAAVGFAGETLTILKSRSTGLLIQMTELAQLSSAASKLDASSLVAFNSDWLVGKVGEAALTDFFKTILPTQVKIVALGGQTSLLFDALKYARPGLFADGRNPAYDNPPEAGYKLRQATYPDGTAYFGASILLGNPTDSRSAADSISNWR
jgi:hypothetical protein